MVASGDMKLMKIDIRSKKVMNDYVDFRRLKYTCTVSCCFCGRTTFDDVLPMMLRHMLTYRLYCILIDFKYKINIVAQIVIGAWCHL